MLRFLILFVGILLGLFSVEMLNPVQDAVIQPFTGLLASISTALIMPFDDSVIAQGRMNQDAMELRLQLFWWPAWRRFQPR
ncbi:hypothetical protein N9L28_07570 [Luminiphilus sp.]|nr:hypothetical protein [Luminiphilus sp.]